MNLDCYERAYDPKEPVVCFDETSKELISETRLPLPMKVGQVQRYDYEYERFSTLNLFLIFEPLASWRRVTVTERRTKQDFAQQMKSLVDEIYPDVDCIHLVMDNLNTHSKAALYETFSPYEARRILRKIHFHYTPKHASWLNMAEIEFSVFSRSCLQKRMPDELTLKRNLDALTLERNTKQATVDWQFTCHDARIKLKRLYPSYLD